MAFKTLATSYPAYPGGRELRDYQKQAVESVQRSWATGTLRPSVVMATGMGKSTVLARLAADHVDNPMGTVLGKVEDRPPRVLFLAHRQELLEQLKDSVLAVRPGTSVGIVQADRNEVDADVVIGSIQTLCKPERREQVADVGLVIVDECHHAVSPTYMSTLAHFGVFSDTIAVGVTATMDRLDQKKLADVWEDVVFTKGIQAGIADGHLVKPLGKAVVIDSLDLSGVKTSKGDFQEGQLGEAVQDAAVDIARAIAVHTKGRTRRIVFVPTVAAAEDLANELEEYGLDMPVVVGTTDRYTRHHTYTELAVGNIDGIVSVGVLTEGWDCPPVDAVVMARPTQSAALYQQCVGRGLRPSPATGKEDCLVLDICEANRIHTLRTLVKLVPDAAYTRAAADGDSLAEDVEELLAELDAIEEAGPAIELEGVLVDRDLFGESAAVWLRTDAGTRFLPAGDWLVFLWPCESQYTVDSPHYDEDDVPYMVGCMSAGGRIVGGWHSTDGRMIEAADYDELDSVDPAELELNAAKRIAEDLAEELGGTLSRKSASWRKGKASPSDAQIRFAKGLGIHSPETKTKARLSDDISQKLASRRLDN